ncbi:MAG: PEP-utilizing enzyme, partial [Gammaproteobacteria bacterium]
RALSNSAGQIDVMPLTALAAEYRRIESELLERWDAPLINDFLCMIAFGLSRKLIERWAGKPGLELHNDVMIGQGDIISAEPAQRIARMAALAKADSELMLALAGGDRSVLARHKELESEVDSYIAKFGDRCTEELKLESITLMDDPRPLLAAIAATARSARNEPARGDERSDPVRALFAGKRLKGFIARRALSWAKARVRDRENLRFERTRVFGYARRLFLAVGRQLHASGILDEPRDVFLLTVPEVLGAIEGFATSADLKGLAAIRKAEMVQAHQRPDPPERISFSGAAVCRSYAQQAARQSKDAGGDLRHATGCCAGTVRGRARVVRDPKTEVVQPGEILVARHTDPGWIALFTNASAIVVERGSLLSHSAIVARELGIPCIVGLKGAMDWLVTGDLIEVDGAAGSVRRLDG